MPFSIRLPSLSLRAVSPARRTGFCVASCVMLLCGAFSAPLWAAAKAPPVVLNPDEQMAAARRELDAHHPVEAAAHWLQVALTSTDETQVEDATRACYENQQLRASLQAAEHWLQLNATSQQARQIAGLSAIKLFQPDVAVTHFKALLESAYITPAAGFIALSGMVEAEDAAAALIVFTQLTQQYPDVAEAHYVLARLAAQLENLDLMQQEAQRAQQIAPYWSPAGLLLARAQMAMGQTDVALATAQAVVKADNSIATRAEYANLLLLANRASDAVTLWRELETQTDGDNSTAIRALAMLDFQVGNYQSAFNRFNRLLNTGRNISESMFYLGGIAERTGANDEARQLYDRVQEGEFASAAQLRVAELIKNSDGLTAALTFLQSYGDANPESMLLTYKARADMLNESGDQVMALKLLDEAVAKFPDIASVRLSQAFQMIRMKKTSAGIRVMRELQKTRPDDPTVLNALGYTLADSGKELQAARNYVADALKVSPDSGPALDSMGWALFKLGRKDEALTYMQRAAKRTLDPDIDLHLGEVLWSLGRKDEALKVWQTSAKRFPDSTAIQERVKRAQAGR